MQRLLGACAVAAAVALLSLAGPAQAAPVGFVAAVAAGDIDMGADLASGLSAGAGFIDGNGNGRIDGQDPDEPLYLDLDASSSVSHGDLRLTPFLRYSAGSLVDMSNRDAGRPLNAAPGWFARDGAQWLLDADNTRTVTAGDVRFAPEGGKVRTGDPALGRALEAAATQRGLLGWADADGDRRHGTLETVYLDLDLYESGGRRVSVGDVRITLGALASDDEASRAELAEAMQKAAVAPPVAPVDAEPEAAGPDTGVAAIPVSGPGWRTLDWILVVVGVANLAGLVVVGRLAAARHPKNPFQ